jgi:hypothetical protein
MVLGQADFDSNTETCDSQGLVYPYDVYVIDNKLIIADSRNNRVLIWDGIPTSSGAPADMVLGQPSMNSCDPAVSVGPSTMYASSGIWSDGTKLVVSDAKNNRVLIWNAFPSEDSDPADIVLGQSNMQTNASGVCASCLSTSVSVFSNGNQLFVADTFNQRVLIWDDIPTMNAEPADRVLGQENFTSNLGGSGAAQFYPYGVFGYQGKLLVSDLVNSRVQIFQAP